MNATANTVNLLRTVGRTFLDGHPNIDHKERRFVRPDEGLTRTATNALKARRTRDDRRALFPINPKPDFAIAAVSEKRSPPIRQDRRRSEIIQSEALSMPTSTKSQARISERAVACIAKPDNNSDMLTFRKWRRRVVDQIMCAHFSDDFTDESEYKALSPEARLVGYAIAERVEQKTKSTKSSSMTLSKAVGLKPDVAQRGIDALAKVGHIRVKHLDSGERIITLALLPDIEPCMPTHVLAPASLFKTPAYNAFLSARATFLTPIFADRKLSPADKLIAFSATRFIEVEKGTIEHRYEFIGRLVGYSERVVRKSIGRLVEAGYFAKDRAPGKIATLTPAMDYFGTDSGTESGTVKSKSAHAAATSSPLPMTPDDSVITDQEEGIDSEPCYGVREPMTRTLDAAHGLWRHILPSFGIPPGHLDGKHHPCPACGGRDRFRFTDRHGDGDFFCSKCLPGKGVKLVANVNGWTYPEAAKRIDEFIGNEPKRKAA